MVQRIKQAISSHPVAAFLIILYPVSWVLFLPDLLGKSGFGLISVDVPYQVGVLLATIFGLTGVAFLVTRLADGKAGTGALRRHYYQFRAGPRWYLMAVLGAPLVLLVAGLVSHGSSALSSIGQHGMSYLLNVAVVAVLISVWEEGGWMGFMTARLQRRWGPVAASLIVAPCFGFVHFPLFFINGGLIENAHPQGNQVFEFAFYLLILFSVPVRILITWVFNSTGGSLPVVALLHASADSATSIFPDVDGRWLYIGIAVVAAVVVVMTRGRLGYLGDPAEGAAYPMPQPTQP